MPAAIGHGGTLAASDLSLSLFHCGLPSLYYIYVYIYCTLIFRGSEWRIYIVYTGGDWKDGSEMRNVIWICGTADAVRAVKEERRGEYRFLVRKAVFERSAGGYIM